MSNPEHLAILKQGVKVWNEWRNRAAQIRPDLREADLRGANLPGVNLCRGNLEGAILFEANLKQADCSGANLSMTNLNGADLRHTILRRCNLDRAHLSTANLSEATLNEANLFQASLNRTYLTYSDLGRARMGRTILANLDLSLTTGLDTVQHSAPSTIGIDTIYRSKANIPEVFLRGCGVPEDLIAYARSLRGKAFEFYSCFISHSVKDKRFCELLYADLQAKGIRVWLFEEDAKWGEPVWGEIDRSIKMYDKLVIVCSESSLQSSPVQREIERALNREDKEHKNILFPIRIDDHIFDKWEHPRKADVLAKVVGDFSGWEHDAAKYEKALNKLLKGLRAVDA